MPNARDIPYPINCSIGEKMKAKNAIAVVKEVKNIGKNIALNVVLTASFTCPFFRTSLKNLVRINVQSGMDLNLMKLLIYGKKKQIVQ